MLLPSASPPTVFINPAIPDNLLDHPIFFGGKAALTTFVKVGLEQAWLSGCKSIGFAGHSARYPLWVRNFVQEIHVYRADRACWESAQKWLEAAALVQSDSIPVETPGIVDECHTRLAAVPWRGGITGFGKGVQFTYKHLALFLSNEWLDDEMINAGSGWIHRQAGARRRMEIAHCLHIQQLQHVHTENIPYIAWARLDHLISAQDVDIIFLPLHVFGNHWDLAIVKFFCVAWIPPAVADLDVWKNMFRVCLQSYVPASGTRLMDDHIMSEQALVGTTFYDINKASASRPI